MNSPPESHDRIVLGLWPIAGVTTMGVTPEDANATLDAAIDEGITRFDTAFSYGYDGESDRLLGRHLAGQRDRFFVMGKVGQRWDKHHQRTVDGSPKQLTQDAEDSLRRLRMEQLDLLYLHQPDPEIPIEASATAMQTLLERGLCRRIGICNASPEQIDRFSQVVPTSAIQCPLNMIQRDSVKEFIEPAHALDREVFVFWTLMKGLLAGKITRDHVFPEGDSRPGYPIFQGDFRRRVHDALDRLEEIARTHDLSVAQFAVSWAVSQPGVSGALVGARRPEQIRETAGIQTLDQATLKEVDRLLGEHSLI